MVKTFGFKLDNMNILSVKQKNTFEINLNEDIRLIISSSN